MNRQRIAQELMAVAKELMAAKRKPKYTTKDIESLMKQLQEFVKRGGRDYGDYQFNIKLYGVDVPDSVIEALGDNAVGDISMEEAARRVKFLGEDVKRRFGWVKDWTQAGRSGGWFGVVDGDYTMDSLESALGPAEDLENFDKLQRNERGVWYRGGPYGDEDELWEELTDDVKGAVEEAKRKVRDLNEIEKMVKAGIADYQKDMKSEGWWEDYL